MASICKKTHSVLNLVSPECRGKQRGSIGPKARWEDQHKMLGNWAGHVASLYRRNGWCFGSRRVSRSFYAACRAELPQRLVSIYRVGVPTVLGEKNADLQTKNKTKKNSFKQNISRGLHQLLAGQKQQRWGKKKLTVIKPANEWISHTHARTSPQPSCSGLWRAFHGLSLYSVSKHPLKGSGSDNYQNGATIPETARRVAKR